MQSLLDSRNALGGIPADLNELFQQGYDASARIHTNSWGNTIPPFSEWTVYGTYYTHHTWSKLDGGAAAIFKEPSIA